MFTSSTSPLKLSLYHFFPFCRTLYTSFSVQMRAAIVYSFQTCNGHFSASNVVYCGVTQLSYQRWSRNSHHIARMDQCHFSQVAPQYTTYDTYDVTQYCNGKLLLPKFFLSDFQFRVLKNSKIPIYVKFSCTTEDLCQKHKCSFK